MELHRGRSLDLDEYTNLVEGTLTQCSIRCLLPSGLITMVGPGHDSPAYVLIEITFSDTETVSYTLNTFSVPR